MKAWPFLLSANPFMESQAVVVPDFIMDSKALREILRAADNAFTHEAGEVIYYRGHRPNVGTIDMVFRIVRGGTVKLLGLNGDAPLLDKKHRPVDVIEGFVFTEDQTMQTFTKEHFDLAHKETEESFRKFWKEKHRWEIVVSQAIDLRPSSGSPLRLKTKSSPTVTKISNQQKEGATASPVANRKQEQEKSSVLPQDGVKQSVQQTSTSEPRQQPVPNKVAAGGNVGCGLAVIGVGVAVFLLAPFSGAVWAVRCVGAGVAVGGAVMLREKPKDSL